MTDAGGWRRKPPRLQTKVKVLFDYYPNEPDPEDSTGMSNDEFERLMDQLSQLGADGVEMKRVSP